MLAAAAILLALQGADLDALKAKFEAEKTLPAAQRLATIGAIGALKSEPAAAFLEKAFDDEKDPAVRYQALRGLADCATSAAQKKVIAVASSVAMPLHFRSLALRAATETRNRESLALARAVSRESGELRLQAFSALRAWPLAETEAIWREALNDPDPVVRGIALAALAPLKDLKMEDFARKALIDPNAETPLKHGSVEVLRVQGGAYNARLLLATAALPDATLRRLVAQALASFNDEKSAQEIYAALHHKEIGVRAAAARALGALKHPKAADKLAEPLADRNPEVHAAALEAVAERKEKNAELVLQKEAQRADEELAAVAISLLAGFPSDATKALLAKLAASYKPGIAIPALEALGELRLADALPVLEKALGHKDWPVRAAAIRALSKLRTKEAVDLLVDRMAKEDGRLLAECGDALRALTGKPLGYAPGGWKEWWSANREGFAFAEKAADPAAAGPGATTYHGIPVVSNRIVFCLDISGSMSEAADGKETRLDQAKKELSRVLSALGKEARINMIFFDDRLEPWKQQLADARANLVPALQTVAALKPRGQTNIFDTLTLAFQHKDADTIYLLSDGEPTAGRIVATEDILRELRKMNRLRQITIHSISFGPSPFMKALAGENGGLYVEIK
jgi:HEAT repeat protein